MVIVARLVADLAQNTEFLVPGIRQAPISCALRMSQDLVGKLCP